METKSNRNASMRGSFQQEGWGPGARAPTEARGDRAHIKKFRGDRPGRPGIKSEIFEPMGDTSAGPAEAIIGRQ
jgi:hypothetical protein